MKYDLDSTEVYPVAAVTCELHGWKKFLLLHVVQGLPVDFPIGCDNHVLFAGVIPSNTSLAVTTRSKKQRQMKESGYQQGSGDGVAGKREGNSPTSARGPVSQYLHWHPEPSLADEGRMQPSTHNT